VTQSHPGTLQSIYNRSRRICSDKAQAHLRDFAVKSEASIENCPLSDSEEKIAQSDVKEAA
jgi:hypothetical protein